MSKSHKTLRIPIKCVDGQWELLYGGAVKVKNHSLAELLISGSRISDPALLGALTKKRLVRILDEGVELRVALTIQPPLAPELTKHLVPTDEMREALMTSKLSVNSRFVRVNLGGPTESQIKAGEKTGGLWLALEGMEPRELKSSTVKLPEIPDIDPAISLNHAFTVLSKLFEPWRKANTGSIYERVFYQEANGKWFPLKDLRAKELAGAERAVIQELWSEIKRQLGLSLL